MIHLIATTRYIINRTVLKLIPLLSKTGISKPIKPRLDEPAGAYFFPPSLLTEVTTDEL